MTNRSITNRSVPFYPTEDDDVMRKALRLGATLGRPLGTWLGLEEDPTEPLVETLV